MGITEIGTANFWKPTKEGEALEGEIIDISESTFEGKKTYLIRTKNGDEVPTPVHEVLCNRMKSTKKGDTVRIEYLGEEPPKLKGYNPTRMYRVFLITP